MSLRIQNIVQWFCNADPKYQIRCIKCGKIQQKAEGWDYQQCELCREYLYDMRNI